MEINIQSIIGTGFQLRVSPFETVLSLKKQIQHLKEIPTSQINLIWQSEEMKDGQHLIDYGVYDGATIKMVTSIRGGPISTQISRETHKTFIDFDDIIENLSSETKKSRRKSQQNSETSSRQNDGQNTVKELQIVNRPSLSGTDMSPFALLIFQDGDSLNYYRLMDDQSTEQGYDDMEYNSMSSSSGSTRRNENLILKSKMDDIIEKINAKKLNKLDNTKTSSVNYFDNVAFTDTKKTPLTLPFCLNSREDKNNQLPEINSFSHTQPRMLTSVKNTQLPKVNVENKTRRFTVSNPIPSHNSRGRFSNETSIQYSNTQTFPHISKSFDKRRYLKKLHKKYSLQENASQTTDSKIDSYYSKLLMLREYKPRVSPRSLLDVDMARIKPKVVDPPKLKKRNKPSVQIDKCQKCKKSVLTMAFDCRCGKIFCIKCQLPEKHKCKFDYKTDGKDKIEKSNPKIDAEKIVKIEKE